MQFLILLTAWILLLAIAWPLAVLALVALPVLWLLSLPFRILGVAVEAIVALIGALLFLPARLLGYRR